MIILGFLFCRFISEDLTSYINEGEREAGDAGFSYAAFADDEAAEIRGEIIEEKGYFILSSQLFGNVVHSCSDPECLEHLNERLAKILTGIGGLDFGDILDAKIDPFGDAYEYLINMYASSAGKHRAR